MQKVKPYISTILIGILVLIILLQRSCVKEVDNKPQISVKLDTVYKYITDTVVKTVPVKKYVYVKPGGLQYTPSTNIDTCTTRFNNLLQEFSKKTTYQDVIKLDSLGTITIVDTLWANKLGKRTYFQDIKIPIVTKTITITKPAKPVRQLYIGGNLFANDQQLDFITPGLIYKTRKDHIYQLNVGINFDGSITYGAGMYWKIKLKK